MQPEQTNPQPGSIAPAQSPQNSIPPAMPSQLDTAPTTPAPTPEAPVAMGPAAARFDMSSIYPTAVEHAAPIVPVAAADTNSTQPQNTVAQQQTGTPGFTPVTTPINPTPVAVATPQQVWPAVSANQAVETIKVPMKNVAIVGIVGPLASTMVAYSVGTVLFSILWDALSSSFGSGESTVGSGLVGILVNPGFIVLYIGILLFLNVKITATYFDDLKIPRPVHAAGLGVLLTFATTFIIIGLSHELPLIGFASSVVALLLMLASFYSGALWYPLGVKWSLLPVESPLKKPLLAVAGVYIAVGVGLLIRGMV